MTLLPDVVPWLLVLDLVAAGIAMLPYRKTAAVRSEHLDSLEFRDEFHERVAGTPLAPALDVVPAMSRDAAESAEQPAQPLLLAASSRVQGLANDQHMKITP